MNLRSFFNFGRKTPQLKSEVELPLLNLNHVRQFLESARGCLNARDGFEFVGGIRAAFYPLQEYVSNETGKILEYGDVLQEFARLTRDRSESKLAALMSLASAMKYAPACGVRFVVAQLILAYGFAGINPGGSMVEFVCLNDEAVEILEAGSKYG